MFKFLKGDVIFFDRNDFINFLIRLGTNGESGHVGLMIDEQNMAEFMKNGFRIIPINDVLSSASGRITVGRLSEQNREKLLRNEKLFDNFIKNMNGKKYDYFQLFKIAIAQFFKNIKLKYNNSRYFCSEFVAESLIITNILKDIIPSNVTPDYLFDLFKSEDFGILYVI